MTESAPVGIDENGRLPLEARDALAADLSDPETEVGAAVAGAVGALSDPAVASLIDDTESATNASLSATIDSAVAAIPTPPVGPVAGHSKSWDLDTHIYNIEAISALGSMRARFASARNMVNPYAVAMIGDSTTAGLGSGQNGVLGWPEHFRRILIEAGYPANYSMMAMANRSVGGPTSVSADSRVTVGSGWEMHNAGSPVAENETTTEAMVFTPEEDVAFLRVYAMSDSGPIAVKIDGAIASSASVLNASYNGTTGVLTPSGGATGLAAARFALTPGAHTISVARTTGKARVVSFDAPESATVMQGLRVLNLGLGGAKAADLTIRTNATHDAIAQQFSVRLAFINIGINDRSEGVSKAAYKASVQNEITRIASFSVVVLMVPTPTSATAASFLPYREALYELADENNVVLIDLYARYESYAVTNGAGLMADATHPNAALYEDMARSTIRGLNIL